MHTVFTSVGALLPHWHLDRIERIAYLPGGYANDNYRFEYEGAAYAVRIVRRSGPARHAEARFLALPTAPDVVAFDPCGGDLVTRWIDGTLLVESAVAPAHAAACLRELHAQIPAGVARYDPLKAIRRDLDAAGPVAAAPAAALELGWAPAEICGCHNDLNPWNILQTGTAWRTLDWEFAGDNDPLFDLVCLGHGLGYDDTEMDVLAAAYLDVQDVAARRLLDTRIVFELREYAWARGQLALGSEREEVRAQAVAAEKSLVRLLERREGSG